MKIGTRLWLGFGVVIGLLVVIVLLSISRMRQAEHRMDDMLEDRYKKVALASEIKYDVSVIHQHVRGALIAGDADGVKREAEAISAISVKNKDLLDTFDKSINVPKGRELFTAITQARSKDLASRAELFALLSDGK
ncbi:MCP four helix bundle domain-containing protein [Actimicrobium sp. CCI2.3]|uniref:MCP four helix bundle domain-containing protein n=1 Tax=Actimicrobium sp. CCI2.3 TaxID=3048616 RepID=UPI002AB4D85E|nr:MCP four helix bundle domain-containing protein [Actimicrobium sp. CCI2.3]MDY7575111.1 MCP four helix bundle domain-containing protein [Actimicrobium sp. CCI2.3]MEB0022548.1 MCP four helix bundle domain-containing protein [Actimicrobium sp. CCI2.3]